MKIVLVFDDWKLHGNPVSGEEYCELAMCDFHSGTAFNATIDLDTEQAAELREAIERGFLPMFWLNFPKEDAKD